MDMEVIYAINEVVSKLNELRSDMHELILTVKNPDRQQPQFQQGNPWPQAQPMPSQQQPKSPRADGYSSVYPNAMQPTGYEHPYGAVRGPQGKPHLRILGGRPIYFKSTLNTESPIDMATVPDSIRKAKEELVASGAVLYEMNIGTHNDTVSIVADLSKVMPCDQMVSKLPESMEMIAHLMYMLLTGHSATLTIIHNEARLM